MPIAPRVLTVVALAAALVAPAAAQALPGDAPIVPVSPTDGGTVAPARDGFTVVFTCPDYRTNDFGDGFALHGRLSDYGAALATSPDLGSDGRLRSDNRIDLSGAFRDNTLAEDQCAAVLGDEPPAGIQPGTYYWQASRLCTGCSGSYESSPVQRVVVRAAVDPTVRAAGAVFAGYPAAFAIAASGAPDGTRAALERRVGRAWRGVGTATVRGGAAEVIATLPAGAQDVRVTLAVGDQGFASPATTVRVGRAGARRSTSAASDGAWKGGDGKPVTFTVAAGGREIRGFRATVTMVCPTVTAPGSIGGQITTQTGFAQFARARIAPDGRFFGVVAAGEQATLVRGRLQGRRLTGGRAELSVGPCTGSLTFAAARA